MSDMEFMALANKAKQILSEISEKNAELEKRLAAHAEAENPVVKAA